MPAPNTASVEQRPVRGCQKPHRRVERRPPGALAHTLRCARDAPSSVDRPRFRIDGLTAREQPRLRHRRRCPRGAPIHVAGMRRGMPWAGPPAPGPTEGRSGSRCSTAIRCSSCSAPRTWRAAGTRCFPARWRSPPLDGCRRCCSPRWGAARTPRCSRSTPVFWSHPRVALGGNVRRSRDARRGGRLHRARNRHVSGRSPAFRPSSRSADRQLRSAAGDVAIVLLAFGISAAGDSSAFYRTSGGRLDGPPI